MCARRRWRRSLDSGQWPSLHRCLALCLWVSLFAGICAGFSSSTVLAQSGISPLSPSQHTITIESNPIIDFALVVGPDDEVLVAWLTAGSDNVPNLSLTRGPAWQVERWTLPEPVAEIGRLVGGWSRDALVWWIQADGDHSYRMGWDGATGTLIPPEPTPPGAIPVSSVSGDVGAYLWLADDGLRLRDAAGGERAVVAPLPGMEGLVAAQSGAGSLVLAWHDGDGALWLYDEGRGLPPIEVTTSGMGHRLVCSGRTCRLFWLEEGEVWTVAGPTWDAPQATGARPASSVAWAPASDALGQAHLVWAEGGKVWHAIEADWAASRSTLGPAGGVTDMALVIGPRGAVHAVWMEEGASDTYGVRYLRWDPRLPQARIVGPSAGECVYGKAVVRLETNLAQSDVESVAFYLEAEPEAGGAVGGSLLALESAFTNESGWSARLDGTQHAAPYRQRVVAQMRCVDGSVRWAWGEWFTLAPRGAPLVWTEGGARAVVYLPEDNVPVPDRLDFYLEPRLDSQTPTATAAVLASDLPRRYVGSLMPDRPGRHILDLPVADLADGVYAVRLWVEGEDGRYLLPVAPQVEIRNSGLPRVTVVAPIQTASAQDEIRFEALADDPDGSVAQVAFYLVSPPETMPQRAVWLGTDIDPSDGWAVRVRPGEEGLWFVRAEATDDDGQRNVAHSEEPIRLTSPVLPSVAFVTPRDGSTVRDVKTVRLSVGPGDAAVDRATLMLAPSHGCYEVLGPLVTTGDELRYAWDTRPLRDGVYRLGAILEFADGRTALIETEAVVANHPPGLRFAAPREGQQVRGWQVVRLVPSVVGGPVQRVELYARDGNGELFPIGEAVPAGDEWVATWSTQTLLDGTYDLVAYLDGGALTRTEVPVMVANETPGVTILAPGDDSLWAGAVGVSWAASDPQGRPLAVSLAFSPNDGQAWLPITANLPISGTYVLDATNLPDSSHGLLRIQASHGAGPAATATRPLVLNYLNEPPHLRLLAPRAGDMIEGSRLVVWECSGVDVATWRAALAYRREGGDWVSLAAGLPATGRYLWDTSSLPSGAGYALRLVVSDSKGREVSASVERLTLSSNAPPAVRLIAPGAGAVFESQVGMLWEATDPDGDPLRVSIDYSDNGGLTWLPVVEDAPDTGYFEWYVAFLPPGRAYRVRVTVTDGRQSAQAASGEFGIGPSPEPRVTLLTPVAAQDLCGHVIVRWRAEAPHAHALNASVLVRRAGDSGWQTLAANIPNDGHYVWDTTGLRDGHYELRVNVSDGIHTATDTLVEPVRVQNHGDAPLHLEIVDPWPTGPWLGFRELAWRLWPLPSEAITGTLLIREAGATSWHPLDSFDPARGRLFLDARQLIAVGAAELALHVTSDGQEALVSLGEPMLLGHYAQAPPKLDLFPIRGHDLSPGDHVLAWQATTAGGKPLMAELWQSTDGGSRMTPIASDLAARGTYWLTAEQITAYDDGALGVTVSDGLFRVRTLSVPVAELLPTAQLMPAVELHTPVVGQIVSGSLAVTWTPPAAHPDASVTLSSSSDGGQTWRRLATIPADRGTCAWDTTRVANGDCWLMASLEQPGWRASQLIVPVIVRNDGRHPPIVSLTMPDTDVPWAGPRRILWVSHDADGDELSMNLAYSVNEGRTWYVIARGLEDTGSYLLDTSLLPNTDRVYLRITASDGAYRTSAVSSFAITVRDPGRPWLELVAPLAGQSCFGLQEIRWVAHDPTRRGTAEVRLELSDDCGATWQEIASGLPLSGSATWDTRMVPNGKAVLLRAVAVEGDELVALDVLPGSVYVRGNPHPPSLPLRLP